MRFLLDTNVIVALEPAGPEGVEPATPGAIRFARLAGQGRHLLLVHPAIDRDYARDREEARRGLRRLQSGRYQVLVDPPAVSERLRAIVGDPDEGSNDWVDDQLLAALDDDRVDFLVTQDQRVHRKARRAGLAERVLEIHDAAGVLASLFDTTLAPPPHVEALSGHKLERSDPIFESFRDDYPDFDDWFAKVRREQRQAWVIPDAESRYQAIAIVEPKKEGKHGLSGRVLKICSFKVRAESAGKKFGELMLKTVFEHCRTNQYGGAYLTVLPKHESLMALLEEFGFEALGTSANDAELIMRKAFAPSDGDCAQGPLDFHVRYGPHSLHAAAPLFVVPIQPRYHSLLFPETEPPTLLLDDPKPFGCAIRKAYLCLAPSKALSSGATLLFYKSKGHGKGLAINEQAVQCVGVVEKVMRSDNAVEVAREVGVRTVYPYEEIAKMVSRKPVLAILFRHAITLPEPIELLDILGNGLLRGVPQSITRGLPEGIDWAYRRLQA